MITNRVVNTFGGLNRISSLRVLSDSLIINGSVFKCKLSKNVLTSMPLDLRQQLNTGNEAVLFDYSMLESMDNLRTLEFDSKSFVYDNVSKALGYANSISVDKFFDDISSLQTLKIDKYTFTRKNYKEEMKKNDIFYYQSKATKFASMCDGVLSKGTKAIWGKAKGTFTSTHHGLLYKIGVGTAQLAATATVGTFDLGAKISKGISKTVDRKRRKRVKSTFSAFKNGVNDLFKK